MRPTAITVCVNYADTLALCEPSWRDWFGRVVVITDMMDRDTERYAMRNRLDLVKTNVFYDGDAVFNKGRAISDTLIAMRKAPGEYRAVIDSDIVMPRGVADGWHSLCPGKMFCAPRRVMPDILDYDPEEPWGNMPLHSEGGEYPGYLQVFHRDDERGQDYPDNWKHAGGCDSEFWKRFNTDCRWLPFEVLHLGRLGVNWCGKTKEGKDLLKDFLETRWKNKTNRHEKL